jgi:hypothetical protein
MRKRKLRGSHKRHPDARVVLSRISSDYSVNAGGIDLGWKLLWSVIMPVCEADERVHDKCLENALIKYLSFVRFQIDNYIAFYRG